MKRILYPVLVGGVLLGLWWGLSVAEVFPVGTVPAPDDVAVTFVRLIKNWELFDATIASLFRVAWGYTLGVVVAVPLGLVIGRFAGARHALMPWVAFFRSLSPIAWTPFAVIWFGIGDPPAIALIFYTTMFVVTVATAAAAAGVPKIYYRVAEDMGLTKAQVLFKITLPAITPQLVISLRVAIGVAWMVVVAAEMIGVRSGLGWLIQDARNGQAWDVIVVGMITIGLIGIGLDFGFARLQKIPSVRWGFER